MTRVLHEADKRQREPILFVDDQGVLRRFTRRGYGALKVHEMLVTCGVIYGGVWQVSPNETAWRIAPSEP